MCDSTIADLIQKRASGELSRDQYWRLLQKRHAQLSEYSGLVRGRLHGVVVTSEGLQVLLDNRLRFWWDSSDLRTAPNLIVADGDYEPEELRVIEAMVEPDDAVVDVGANVGWYTLHLSRIVGSRGRVLSFEPIPGTFDKLTRNISLNPESGTIEAYRLGLSDSSGPAVFSLPSESGSVAASARAIMPHETNIEVEVELVRLDDFVAERSLPGIGLMKCDIEGAEISALRGALETIERHRPVIAVEMLRKWTAVYDYTPGDIISMLASLGYECWSIGERTLRRVQSVSDQTEETNFFFLLPGVHDRRRARAEKALAKRQDDADE